MSFWLTPKSGSCARSSSTGPVSSTHGSRRHAEELLFDDVIWVKRAKAMMASVRPCASAAWMLDAEELLSEAPADVQARDWILDQVLDERHVGVYHAVTA